MYFQDLINQFMDKSLCIERHWLALICQFKPIILAYHESKKAYEFSIILLYKVFQRAIKYFTPRDCTFEVLLIILQTSIDIFIECPCQLLLDWLDNCVPLIFDIIISAPSDLIGNLWPLLLTKILQDEKYQALFSGPSTSPPKGIKLVSPPFPALLGIRRLELFCYELPLSRSMYTDLLNKHVVRFVVPGVLWLPFFF